MPFEGFAVDIGDGSEESRRALWDMAFGLLALADEDPDPRRPPMRGESAWAHELAARHAAGAVAASELEALVDLHYLDERDAARLAEARADGLAARIVAFISEGRPDLSPRGLREACGFLLPGDSARPQPQAPAFRSGEVDEPEGILAGRSVRYVAASIIEDVLVSAFARFRQLADAPGAEAQRMLGAALLDLVVTIWRARPFGRPDALVAAALLLLVLKDRQVMVSPGPFALHAPYFRRALVRACFSDPKAEVREDARFIGMFLADLFAGGSYPLRDSDTACRELLAVRERRIVHEGDRGNYLLKAGDVPIAALRFERGGAAGLSVDALEIDERHRALLPLNLLESCDAIELERFVKSRVMSRGRAHRGDILGAYGISGATTWAIVHFSRGISPSDSYSIVRENDDAAFDDCCAFGNPLDATLQEVALAGRSIKGGTRALREGVPLELVTGGNGPKAWRQTETGGLALFKAGAGRDRRCADAERISLAIAAALGAGAAESSEEEWFGIPCTAVRGFASRDVSFVPFALTMAKGELDACALPQALGFYRGVGRLAEASFRAMLVLDCLLANPARTAFDHGVMRDARSGEVLAAAPLFDFDEALFARDRAARDAGPDELARRARDMQGPFGVTLGEQALFALDGAGEGLLEMLERARSLDCSAYETGDAPLDAAVRAVPLIAGRLLLELSE